MKIGESAWRSNLIASILWGIKSMASVNLRSGLGRAAYKTSQAVNVILFVGGLFLTVAVSLELIRRIATYGGPVDGDVVRGPGIVIATGLITAVFAAIAFLLLRIGQRWGSWFDALIWAVGWLPASINLSAYIRAPGVAYLFSTIVCGIGIFVSIATFLLMPPSPQGVADSEATI